MLCVMNVKGFSCGDFFVQYFWVNFVVVIYGGQFGVVVKFRGVVFVYLDMGVVCVENCVLWVG